MQLVTFRIDERTGAFSTERVERIVRAVRLEPIPNGPPSFAGVFNLHGEIVPVVSLRTHMGLPERTVCPEDYLVIHTAPTRIAFLVDAVIGLLDFKDEDIHAASELLPGLTTNTNIGRLPEGCLVITDPASIVGVIPDDIGKAHDLSPHQKSESREGSQG